MKKAPNLGSGPLHMAIHHTILTLMDMDWRWADGLQQGRCLMKGIESAPMRTTLAFHDVSVDV